MPQPTPTPERDEKWIFEEKPQPVAPAERYQMIADAAYFYAEKRGFVGGDVVNDWLQAEAEIDRLLQPQEHAGSAESPEKQAYLEKLEASYRDWDARHETRKTAQVRQAWLKPRYVRRLKLSPESGQSLRS